MAFAAERCDVTRDDVRSCSNASATLVSNANHALTAQLDSAPPDKVSAVRYPLLSMTVSRHAKRFASTLVLLLTAVALLMAVVRGGTRFFYCPMTHLAFDESPCASKADANAEAGENENENADPPAVRISDCCQERWRATAPTAAVPKIETPSVAAAALVAVLAPPAIDASSTHASVPFTLPRDVRAGPPPKAASVRRARLMVFHI